MELDAVKILRSLVRLGVEFHNITPVGLAAFSFIQYQAWLSIQEGSVGASNGATGFDSLPATISQRKIPKSESD